MVTKALLYEHPVIAEEPSEDTLHLSVMKLVLGILPYIKQLIKECQFTLFFSVGKFCIFKYLVFITL